MLSFCIEQEKSSLVHLPQCVQCPLPLHEHQNFFAQLLFWMGRGSLVCLQWYVHCLLWSIKNYFDYCSFIVSWEKGSLVCLQECARCLRASILQAQLLFWAGRGSLAWGANFNVVFIASRMCKISYLAFLLRRGGVARLEDLSSMMCPLPPLAHQDLHVLKICKKKTFIKGINNTECRIKGAQSYLFNIFPTFGDFGITR